MQPAPTLKPSDDIPGLIYEGTAATTGDEFFRALVRATAQAMEVRWAFVSEFAGSRERVRTLAFWDGGDFAENFEYDLDGTVCAGVLAGELRYYPKNVAPQFPREKALVEMGIESYLAVPMMTPQKEVLGHLAIPANGPIVNVSDTLFSQPPEVVPATPDSGTLDAVQKAHIVDILDPCNWRIEGHRGAATALGLKPEHLALSYANARNRETDAPLIWPLLLA